MGKKSHTRGGRCGGKTVGRASAEESRCARQPVNSDFAFRNFLRRVGANCHARLFLPPRAMCLSARTHNAARALLRPTRIVAIRGSPAASVSSFSFVDLVQYGCRVEVRSSMCRERGLLCAQACCWVHPTFYVHVASLIVWSICSSALTAVCGHAIAHPQPQHTTLQYAAFGGILGTCTPACRMSTRSSCCKDANSYVGLATPQTATFIQTSMVGPCHRSTATVQTQDSFTRTGKGDGAVIGLHLS